MIKRAIEIKLVHVKVLDFDIDNTKREPEHHFNLTKNMKTYIRRQQHKNIFIHQDIKQKEPPQKYRLGTISNTKLLAGLNRFYMAITSPSASAVVHNI